MLRNRSVFITWLLSYIVVLVIPLALSISVFLVTNRSIETEVDRSNNVLLEQVRLEIDNQLRDIVRLGSQIALDSELRSLVLSSPPLTPNQRYTIVELTKEFGILSSISSFIDSFYVYIPALEAGIGPNS